MTADDGQLSFTPFAQLQVFPEIPPDELLLRAPTTVRTTTSTEARGPGRT